MTGLNTFRSRLGSLKYRRALARWQAAIARGMVLAIVAMFALLLIDLSFRLQATPRLILIFVIVGVWAWQALRHILPDLSNDETVVDIAILLERTHGVDSDLVAALQFDASASNSAGSLALQRAVIERAAKISETLDFRSAVPRKDARRATWIAAFAVLSVSVLWLSFPSHATAFWNRLWLGDANYPTRTHIEEVAINGRSDAARVVEDETVVFVVKCSGVTPAAGLASLRGIETGDSTSIVLKRIDESSGVAVYAADGPRLNEAVEYSIQIGDATTELRRIEIVRRPLVELTMEAVAPAYMQLGNIRQLEHYVQVMEGSAIELSVRCTNEKRLTEVKFQLTPEGGAAEPAAIAFVPADDARMLWRLTAQASGLTRVVKEFQFRVVVLDEDGLGTYHPIEGAIRIKRDRVPTATLASQHQAVMPNARPTISYTAEDDFGVGALKLRVRRAGSRDPGPAAAPMRDEREPVELSEDSDAVSVFDLPLPKSSEARPRKTHVADHVLELSPFELVKGDKLLVWIEVADYRGSWPGVSAVSESIELEVLDERGVLDAILRSDADAEQMLTDVIEKELGLKGDR